MQAQLSIHNRISVYSRARDLSAEQGVRIPYTCEMESYSLKKRKATSYAEVNLLHLPKPMKRKREAKLYPVLVIEEDKENGRLVRRIYGTNGFCIVFKVCIFRETLS